MPSLLRVSTWVFGEDGDTLTDPTTQSLLVASSVLITGVMVVSPLVADLAIVFDVSVGYAGMLITIFTGTAAFTLPFVGVLTDQIGRKPVMVAGLILFGIAGALIGFVTTFEMVLLLRILQGIGFACASPVILTLFGDLYEGSRETTVQGMRVSMNSVISTGIPVVAGVLFVYWWRYPFLLYLISIPSAIWVWHAVPDIEAANNWSVRAYLRNMSVFLLEKTIFVLMLSFGLRFALYYVFLTYISALAIEEAELAVVAVGVLLSINGFVKMIGSTQAGRLTALFNPDFLSFIAFVVMTAGIVSMGLYPSPVVITAGVIVFAIGDSVLAPCQKSLVNRLSPPAYRGGAMTTALTFQNLGKFVGPLVLGTILGFIELATSFVIAGMVAGGLGVISTFLIWLWTR